MKIDGLEIVMQKHMKKCIEEEIEKRLKELIPGIAKRYTELLNLRNTETDQFNDGFLAARNGKLEGDHPYYEFDTDNWRLGYAWGMYEPMKQRIEELLINIKTSLSVENDELRKEWKNDK